MALRFLFRLGHQAKRRRVRGFLFDPSSNQLTILGTLGGGYSHALGINEAGQVVGVSITGSGSYHALITGSNGQGMTDLGTLGGRDSRAHGINDAGQVVGYVTGTFIPEPASYVTMLIGLGLIAFVVRRMPGVQ